MPYNLIINTRDTEKTPHFLFLLVAFSSNLINIIKVTLVTIN